MEARLLEILRCPESLQTLHPADEGVLELINARIREGSARNRAGESVREPLDGGLIRGDGAFLYPIRRGIPSMIIGQALPLKSAGPSS